MRKNLINTPTLNDANTVKVSVYIRTALCCPCGLEYNHDGRQSSEKDSVRLLSSAEANAELPVPADDVDCRHSIADDGAQLFSPALVGIFCADEVQIALHPHKRYRPLLFACFARTVV